MISVVPRRHVRGSETPDVSLTEHEVSAFARHLQSFLEGVCECLSSGSTRVHHDGARGRLASFRVVDRQGEADLERPVPSLRDQPGVHRLHGKFRKAEAGGPLGARREPSPWQGHSWGGGGAGQSTITPKVGGAGAPL